MHRRVWWTFVSVVVAFYVSVLYLFFYHKPPVKSAASALRAQQQQEGPREEGQAASSDTPPSLAAVQNPPGSIDGVVVLGMHRSGTSMITGLLERMGLHLGDPTTLLGPRVGALLVCMCMMREMPGGRLRGGSRCIECGKGGGW